MKRKIKVVDNITGKTTEGEVEIRNLDHFNVQLNTKAVVYKDKTKYTRKQKHKKLEEN